VTEETGRVKGESNRGAGKKAATARNKGRDNRGRKRNGSRRGKSNAEQQFGRQRTQRWGRQGRQRRFGRGVEELRRADEVEHARGKVRSRSSGESRKGGADA
jgi:hypothetical protein